MNVNEYGQLFRFNAFTDISSTTPTLILEPRVGECIERTIPDISIPAATITVNGQTFNANEYVEYVVQEGDLTYAGRWRAKLKTLYSPTKELISDWQRFTVMP